MNGVNGHFEAQNNSQDDSKEENHTFGTPPESIDTLKVMKKVSQEGKQRENK